MERIVIKEKEELLNQAKLIKKHHKRIKFVGIILAIVFFVAFNIIVSSRGSFRIAIIIFGIALIACVGLILAFAIGGLINPNSEYSEAKNKLFSCFIKYVIGNVKEIDSINESGYITDSIYSKACFDPEDKFESDYDITGKIENSIYHLSEVKTYTEHRDDDGDSHYTLSFSGMFMEVDLPEDKTFDLYVGFNDTLFGNRNDIKTGNERFDKKYLIKSDNELFTMMVLTPTVTTYILDNNEKAEIEFSIVDNKLYFRLRQKNLIINYDDVEKLENSVNNSVNMFNELFPVIGEIVKNINEFNHKDHKDVSGKVNE